MDQKTKLTKFEGKYWQGVGRRKTSVASVRIYKTKISKDVFWINNRKLADFFPCKELREAASSPLKILGKEKNIGVNILVRGGGVRAQAEAIRHGLSRALVKFREEFKKELRDLGYLTRDSRKVERKKPGLKKARRAGQFSKR
ncbi:MAG: 30S ribosomal protein S9 [Patescibacteria group bacterium]|nr:30S ribosomal protein S9 [Patescibacteria group bacterium]